MPKTIMLYAVPLTESLTDEEDEGVAGTYACEVYDSVPESLRVSAALDAFHGSVAVGTLEDFAFICADEGGNVLHEADAQDNYDTYDLVDSADVEKVSDEIPAEIADHAKAG